MPEDEWTIFEDTHEAIIDQETFDLAQKVRSKVRRYPDGWGEVAPLTGLMYCADCGGKMYIIQMWAEVMEIYRSGKFKLKLSKETDAFLKAHQREFMPEDTKAGQIIDYLERYSGNMVCSKQLYREALGHDYDEPKQWELREINDIMNNAVTGWRAFANPRYFPEPYRRQRGWERIPTDNEPDNNTGEFHELTEAEMQQLELPEEWLR